MYNYATFKEIHTNNSRVSRLPPESPLKREDWEIDKKGRRFIKEDGGSQMDNTLHMEKCLMP